MKSAHHRRLSVNAINLEQPCIRLRARVVFYCLNAQQLYLSAKQPPRKTEVILQSAIYPTGNNLF